MPMWTDYWQGHLLKHPAQCNLHGLDVDFIVGIIQEFVEAAQAEAGPIRNYEDWLIASYGKTFTEHFPARYGQKYHTVHPREMSTDWLGPRLYRPGSRRSAARCHDPMKHRTFTTSRISATRPTEGSAPIWTDCAKGSPSVVDHEVIGIDPRRRELSFRGGKTAGYDALISSMPLPALVRGDQGRAGRRTGRGGEAGLLRVCGRERGSGSSGHLQSALALCL